MEIVEKGYSKADFGALTVDVVPLPLNWGVSYNNWSDENLMLIRIFSKMCPMTTSRAAGRSIPAPGNIVKKKIRSSKSFSQSVFIASAHFSVEVHAISFILSTGLWGV